MNRIDAPNAAQQLRRTLEEMTRQRVENFKLGEPNKMANGGMTRELTATVGGVDLSYHAVEIGGRVSIVQQGLGVSPERAHELLYRNQLPTNATGITNGWPERTTAAERAARQASQVRSRRR